MDSITVGYVDINVVFNTRFSMIKIVMVIHMET